MPPDSGQDTPREAPAAGASPTATPALAGPSPTTDAAPPAEPAASADGHREPILRRLGLLDSAVPLLAALVGLIALAGAVMVEMRADARTEQLSAEVADLHAGIVQLQQQAAALAKAQDNGTVEGLLALQDRIARLEDAAKQTAAQPASPAIAPLTGTPARPPVDTSGEAAGSSPAATGSTQASTGGDCIPVGIRFMATPNQSYPMCGSKMVVKVDAIGAGTVDIGGSGTIAANSFGTLPGGKCTVTVLSADEAGFAELRVSCS